MANLDDQDLLAIQARRKNILVNEASWNKWKRMDLAGGFVILDKVKAGLQKLSSVTRSALIDAYSKVQQ